ncbi:MAG TPA: FtsX-like permease family protein [Sediminibacterium sp.]|nr:FtsX-like permease family protein [Sediminibacterium sp.]
MNTSFFIAKRLAFSKQRSFSRFIIRLSVGATVVGVAAMIITLCFVNGFQEAVAKKVYSFWGHVRVQHFEPDKSMVAEEVPITRNTAVFNTIRQTPGVVTVQSFATKSAVIEKNKNIEGILLKGIEAEYDSATLKPYMVSGRWIRFEDSLYSREIILSQQLSNLMGIRLNDTISLYFISSEDGSRTYRKLRVAGIYKTGIEEYDKLFAIGDLRLIRRINNWEADQIGGYEIFINDHRQADQLNATLLNTLPAQWMSRTIQSVYPNIFDWLDIQDVNRDVIFIIMTVVALINLITCLLILILERTRMIGLLKAIGATESNIIRIFLYYATVIAGIGIGGGFILGTGICLLQQYTGVIALNESSYYVSSAPVKIIWWQLGVVCLFTWIICYGVLIIPAFLVKKINPITAIRFR